MLRDEKRYNLQEFISLLEKWKGNDSWYRVSKKCRISQGTISQILNGKFKPGHKTIMRLACIAPLAERNRLYNKLLDAAGIGGSLYGQIDH